MRHFTSIGLASVVLVASFGLGACSSDDDDGGAAGSSATGGGGGKGGTSGTGGAGTGGGSSGTGGSATGGTGGSATGGTGGSATGGTGGTATGGTSGAAGAAGAAGFDVEAFCDEYETVCGLGAAERFDDHADCVDQTSGFTAARQTCVETHLGYAQDPGPLSTHCPHAAGLGSSPTTCGA